MISFYWFENDMEWQERSFTIYHGRKLWREMRLRKEDAEVWDQENFYWNKLLSSIFWRRVILQSEKAEKCLYNFCSSISCGFVLSLLELSEGVMLYLHGICNTEGLEAFSICSSMNSWDFSWTLCDWTWTNFTWQTRVSCDRMWLWGVVYIFMDESEGCHRAEIL